MAEVYPSDAALNALSSDTETGVEYITTGQAPYYTNWRKAMQRHLLASKRANDLRVFDEGSLDVGVKAGKYFTGTAYGSYSGSTGNTLTDNTTNYLYLNSAGALTVNTTGYPSDRVNHIRLATVTTASGEITAITDDRGYSFISPPSGVLDEPEFYSEEAGASVVILGMHWNSASPADGDLMQMSWNAENAAGTKTEYGRIQLELDDTGDASGNSEDAHFELLEIVAGVLTNQGDIVGTTKSQTLTNKTLDEAVAYSDSSSVSVEIFEFFWEKGSPADNDEMRVPFYGEDAAGANTEYARLTMEIDDSGDASGNSEDAHLAFSEMVAGTLTDMGSIVGTSSARANAAALQVVTSSVGVPFVLTATLAAGNTVAIYSSNAPFKFRILDAWSIADSADSGTWKLTDGSNDITDAVAVTGTDKTIDRAGTIDDAYYEIAASGSLSVVGDGSNEECEDFVLAVRVS